LYKGLRSQLVINGMVKCFPHHTKHMNRKLRKESMIKTIRVMIPYKDTAYPPTTNSPGI
jgi:hypothetical protein